MKYWKQSLIVLGISALAVPVAAFAAQEGGPALSRHASVPPLAQTILQQNGLPAETAKTGASKALRESASLSAHKQMYYTLLSDKYMPGDTEKWKAAFAERDRLIGELKAIKPTTEQKAAIKEKLSAGLEKLHQEHKAGTLDKQSLQDKIKELKESRHGLQELKAENWDGILAGRKELQQSFTEAVKAGDAGAISSVLPKLLEQTRQENTALAQLAAKLQAQWAQVPASAPAEPVPQD